MYCIQCGVKLADTEHSCPLCGTEVVHHRLKQTEAAPLYPPHRYPNPQIQSRAVLIVISTLMLIALLSTLFTDLMINKKVVWSGYVVGGILVGYTVFVLPFWFRKRKETVYILCLFSAVGMYLHYINAATGGDWFLAFAFPLTVYLGILTLVMTVLLKRYADRVLYIVGGGLIALGLYMPMMEYLIFTAFEREKFAAWSGYPLISLVLLGGMLIFLGVNAQARETMERKFFV